MFTSSFAGGFPPWRQNKYVAKVGHPVCDQKQNARDSKGWIAGIGKP
jgi:hypothetical protein